MFSFQLGSNNSVSLSRDWHIHPYKGKKHDDVVIIDSKPFDKAGSFSVAIPGHVLILLHEEQCS